VATSVYMCILIKLCHISFYYNFGKLLKRMQGKNVSCENKQHPIILKEHLEHLLKMTVHVVWNIALRE